MPIVCIFFFYINYFVIWEIFCLFVAYFTLPPVNILYRCNIYYFLIRKLLCLDDEMKNMGLCWIF